MIVQCASYYDLPSALYHERMQARLETTMRSFPSSADVAREAELEKQELKRKRTAHEVSPAVLPATSWRRVRKTDC